MNLVVMNFYYIDETKIISDENLPGKVVNRSTFISNCFLTWFSVPVGHRPPIGVRVGPLRRQRGAPEAADVELVPPPGELGAIPPGSPPPRQDPPPREELHRQVQVSPRQHLRIPGEHDFLPTCRSSLSDRG